jgi:perosamine synthetase
MTEIVMSAPTIDDSDIAMVVKVLKSGQLSIGPFVDEFERRFANYVGTKHAIAVSSGTAGLHLCICAAGIGFGDEVITTTFSFVASANCILYERAKPIFVDIDERSLNIDAAQAAAAVSGRTRAILPVHIFGRPPALAALGAICRRHNLVLIEDACEALGAEYHGKKVGSFGDAAVFGFYPNKQMTMGEGGVITTDHREWDTKLRSLRNQGRHEMGTWLRHDSLGFNYRLNEMSAALGVSQLSRIDQLLERRNNVAAMYLSYLKDAPGVTVLSPVAATSRPSWFVFVVRLEEGISRSKVIEELNNRGIPTRVYFPPIHLQPYFVERFGYRKGDFPVAERVARSTLALPFHANMSQASVEQVATALKRAISRSSTKSLSAKRQGRPANWLRDRANEGVKRRDTVET